MGCGDSKVSGGGGSSSGNKYEASKAPTSAGPAPPRAKGSTMTPEQSAAALKAAGEAKQALLDRMLSETGIDPKMTDMFQTVSVP